jgi:hypothetical protein
MRDNNCRICGKDTGRGGRGNSKVKYEGGYRHYECVPITKNPEIMKNYWVEYRKNNPHKIKAWRDKWRINNPDWYKKYYWNNRHEILERLLLQRRSSVSSAEYL